MARSNNKLPQIRDLQDCGDGDDDIHVLALVKGPHRFIWIYTPANKTAVLHQLGQFASRPDLPEFTYYDAAVLSQKIRQEFAEEYEGN
jgi:hypothetical protein